MPLSYCNCEFKLLILLPFYICLLVFILYSVSLSIVWSEGEREKSWGLFSVLTLWCIFLSRLLRFKKKSNCLMYYFRPIWVSFTLKYTNYICYKSVDLWNPADRYLEGLCFVLNFLCTVSERLTVHWLFLSIVYYIFTSALLLSRHWKSSYDLQVLQSFYFYI